MPAAVEACLCELRGHHPQWSQRRLAHEFARDGIDPPPGLTSIYRALVRNGLIQPKARRRPKASYRRWERDRPMALWQLDVMGGIWLTDGRELCWSSASQTPGQTDGTALRWSGQPVTARA
jgi:hypothetical protein